MTVVSDRLDASSTGPRKAIRRRDTAAVGLVAVVSAVGALTTTPHPTASRPADIVLTLGFSAGIVALASVARPMVWLVIAVTVTVAAGATGPWFLLTATAALVSVIALRAGDQRPRPVVGALVGAVVVQSLLRMPTERFGANLVLSFAVVGGLVAFTWPDLGGTTRRWLRRGAVVVGVGVALAVLGLGLALALARQAVQQGAAGADDGLDAARAGRGDRAAELLDDAGDSFTSAHAHLVAWWAKPARLVPGVGQHAQALEVLTEEGARLTTAAARAARSANVEDIRVTDGQLDLDHVRSMEAPLVAVRDALGRADRSVAGAESPWLIAPLAHRIEEFQHSIDAATDDATTASMAVAVLPDLLGGNGERRYFIVFGTPSEARDLGGFMGAYGILQAVDGELSLRSTGRVRNLNTFFAGGQLTDPSVFPDHYLALRPQRFWQNITGTPDFPTVAEAVHQLWKPPGAPLDGVLYMDPHTLAIMLELTGPIRLDGYDTPLTAATAPDFLLRDQYILFPDDDRHDFLVDAASTVFEELTSGELAAPNELADVLGPAVRQRRLLFNSFRADEQAVVERLDLDGSLPPVDGDFLSVRASNRGRSKIDAFMRRHVTYAVHVDPGTGAVRSTVTVEIANDAPSTGLPYPVIGNHLDRPTGTSSTTVSVYTPLELVDVQVDGASIARGAHEEYDRNRFSALVDIPPGESLTVTFDLEGTLDLRHGYHLDVVPQPLAQADQLTFTLAAADGWVPGGDALPSGALEEDKAVDVSFFSFGAE